MDAQPSTTPAADPVVMMRYKLPQNTGLTPNQIIALEKSFQGIPNLKNVSILSEPEMLTEAQLERENFEARKALPILQLDLTREDRDQAIQELLQDRNAKQQGVAPEMEVITAAMRTDAGYAWAWACNLAMSFYDEGVDHATANRGAARFLRLLGGVDLSQFSEYQRTQAIVERYDYEEQIRTAQTREEFYQAYLTYFQETAARTGQAPQLRGFPDVDRGNVQWPLAFRFGYPTDLNSHIGVLYIASGEEVTRALQPTETADAVPA